VVKITEFLEGQKTRTWSFSLEVFLMLRFITILAVALAVPATSDAMDRAEKEPYDYHKSEAYSKLTKDQQKRMAVAEKRLKKIQASLHKYSDDYNGNAPTSLELLVPKYLDKLPKDPFATKESAAEKAEDIKPLLHSVDGRGFRYRSGRARSWWLYSVGLRDFPFRYDSKNNTGVGYVQGYWHGPAQFTFDVF